MSTKKEDHDQVRTAPVVNAAVGHDCLQVAEIGAAFIGIDRLVFGAVIAPDGLAETLPQRQESEDEAQDLEKDIAKEGAVDQQRQG